MSTVYCYTSTGNSLYVATKIAEKIGGRVAAMSGRAARCEDTVVGFVFPVYFWGLPRAVERFIEEMQITNRTAYVFAVATYGGVVYGVPGRVKRLLAAKGVSLRYGKNLKMVENYIPVYKVNDSEAFRLKIERDIGRIADDVSAGKSNRVQPFTFVNRAIHRAYPNEGSDRDFTVSGACTGCAVCQGVCPVKNIAMASGKPAFHHRCEHCLACLHNCPVQAIDWKGKTQGKARFRNGGVSIKDMMALYAAGEGGAPEGE